MLALLRRGAVGVFAQLHERVAQLTFVQGAAIVAFAAIHAIAAGVLLYVGGDTIFHCTFKVLTQGLRKQLHGCALPTAEFLCYTVL